MTDAVVDGTVTHSDGIPIEVPPHTEKRQINALPADFYTTFLSDAAKRRKPSPIRSLFPLENNPGLISLLAGKPNASTFPLTSLQFTARSPIEPFKEVTLQLSEDELAEGLQYGPTAGQSSLIDWVYGLQEYSHERKRGEGWRVSIGSGSQDLISKAFTALVNPGDSILLESPVYAGAIPMFQFLECEPIEVLADSKGINASSLRSILENWPASKPKPRILYAVPYGCNPTGMTHAVERRKEVLALAREHNFLILEDDPYYYLYYGCAPRPPSYFALELEEPEVGRVLRFDSLSKIVSAGLRIGFASGPEALLNAMDHDTATNNLQVSGLSQMVAAALLNSWGYDAFKAHTEMVSQFYKQKRGVFEAALRRHLHGLIEWSSPEAGMFIWFKLLLSPHANKSSEDDSESTIRTKAFERGVLALPGTVFMPDGRKTAYVRASFSLLNEDQVEEAAKRLREAILDARKTA